MLTVMLTVMLTAVSRDATQEYTQSCRRLLQADAVVLPNNVSFQRIWWNKARGVLPARGGAVSLWRPLPPPGYCALGACMGVAQRVPFTFPKKCSAMTHVYWCCRASLLHVAMLMPVRYRHYMPSPR